MRGLNSFLLSCSDSILPFHFLRIYAVSSWMSEGWISKACIIRQRHDAKGGTLRQNLPSYCPRLVISDDKGRTLVTVRYSLMWSCD